MTNAAAVQAKLYKGWGKAATKTGFAHSFYRGHARNALLDQANDPLKNQAGLVMYPRQPSADMPDYLLDQSGARTQDQAGDDLTGQQVQSAYPDYLLDQSGQHLLDQQGDDLTGQTGAFPSSPMAGRSYATLNVSLNAQDMKYRKPSGYGKPLWYAVLDGTDVAVGDYFDGPLGTFFIATMQPLLPILAVECNRTVSISTPQSQGGAGSQGYGGSNAANRTTILTGWPASILAGTKGERSPANLPDDTRSPWWTMLLPETGVQLDYAQVVTDDLGRDYTISSAELSDLGWRLTMQLNVT